MMMMTMMMMFLLAVESQVMFFWKFPELFWIRVLNKTSSVGVKLLVLDPSGWRFWRF